MATPLPELKIAKNGSFAIKMHAAKGLKLCMHTQLDSGSNMGLCPPGHTSLSGCVSLKTVCMYVCMVVCIHFITKAPY